MKRQLVTPLVLLLATLALPAAGQGREEFRTGPCAAPPPQAAAAGFTRLDFQLDPRRDIDIGWNNRPGHDWYPGMWWEPRWPSSNQIVQDRANGVLRITDAYLATIVHRDPSPGGRTWNGGYFEIDGLGHNLSSFWLMSLLHARRGRQIASDPLTYTSELDIYEGDEGTPNTLTSTLHRDTSHDAGVPDSQNRNNNKDVSPIRIAGVRHKIGGLWLPDRVDIYLDGNKVNSFPTVDSTNQPMFLIIGNSAGGVNRGPTVDPQEYQVYSVCVWQK